CGFVSLVMKNPAHGTKLRAKFMRKDNSYETVFSDQHVIQVWLAITEILKRVEAALNKVRPPGGAGERFLAHWRNLIAFLIVAKVTGRFSYSVSDLVKFDFAQITPSLVGEMWNLAVSEMGGIYRLAAARKALFVAACCTKAANDYGIVDVAVVGRRTIPNIHTPDKAEKLDKQKARKEEKRLLRDVPDDVIRRVDAILPHQPWKPGIHHEIAGKLGLDPKDVSVAIGRLIRSGRRHHQRDGVVYGSDGKVIAVDHDRAEAKESNPSGPEGASHRAL